MLEKLSSILILLGVSGAVPQPEAEEPMPEPEPFDLRVATFNIEDLRPRRCRILRAHGPRRRRR